LQTIRQNNAVTQDLSLAILASGISQSDYEKISTGGTATIEQEQNLFGAFLIIRNASLQQILTPLLVKTANLVSLADLLNVQKMFPNSYETLTVPVYNLSSGPTNSKTYYLIYKDAGLNTQLTQPAINEQIGSQVIAGQPLLSPENVTIPTQLDPIDTTSDLETMLLNNRTMR
jgi:hypothetical protein